jgi:hypothetical protein
MVLLGFELKTLHLLGRYAIPLEPLNLPFFVLVIFVMGSRFGCPDWPQTAILLIFAF